MAGRRLVVDARHDFVSSPCFARDGGRLAWLSWDHPNMPWDGTTLWLARFGEAGPAGEPTAVAGGATESVFQPGFSPGGVLTFVSDRSGWWNLHQLREGRVVGPPPRAAEFGAPQWQLGSRTWGFLDERTVLCAVRSGGFDRLARLDLASGALDEIALPYTSLDGIDVGARRAAFLGAGSGTPLALCALDLAAGPSRFRWSRASSPPPRRSRSRARTASAPTRSSTGPPIPPARARPASARRCS